MDLEDDHRIHRVHITWAQCSDLNLKVMSVRRLQEEGVLDRLDEKTRRRLLSAPGGFVFTAWSDVAGAAYIIGAMKSDAIWLAD